MQNQTQAQNSGDITFQAVRAVALVIDGGQVVLIHRWKNGREYYTFPGGGVEVGESPEQAAEREVKEETSLEVKVERLLYRHIYDNGTEQYFYLCRYLAGEIALAEDSIEAEKMRSGDNDRYCPGWYSTLQLPELLVYPLEIRDQFLADLADGFSQEVKTWQLKISQLRQSL